MKKYLLILLLSFVFGAPSIQAEAPSDFTEPNLKNFILSWYHSTNDHLPKEDLLRFLDDNVEFIYPDTPKPVVGKQAFLDWYARALDQYFDETHTIEKWKSIEIKGDHATVSLVVRWEYRTWKTGEARSQYQANLAHQRWEIQRNPADGSFKTMKKIVESFEKTAPIYEVGP